MKTTVYARAKRAKKGKINKKRVVTCICIPILLIAIIYFISSNKMFEIRDNQTQETIEEIKNTVGETNEKEDTSKHDEVVDVDIPAKMGDYEVLGQLVIDKIEVTKNILNISEDASLKLSVAKLYGPNINESGNFCVDGHNWNNMLKRLSEMKVGETFYIVKRDGKTKVTYKIYDMYTCVPEDISCLNQNNDGKREVTLITCNPGGLTRLICKAREI